MAPPEALHWLFWDVEPADLDLEQHAHYILARVLERGRLSDVTWAIGAYGLDTIHAFFRDAAHPELSARTLAFWRALFRAEDTPWRTVPAWRKSSSAPWHD
jgi:hypothetical protein